MIRELLPAEKIVLGLDCGYASALDQLVARSAGAGVSGLRQAPDGPGFPLTVMGVLAVDVGTDLVPAMGLALEPPEPGIMARPPRRRSEKLLSLRFVLRAYLVEGAVLALGCFATDFYAAWALGFWRPGRRTCRRSPPTSSRR